MPRYAPTSIGGDYTWKESQRGAPSGDDAATCALHFRAVTDSGDSAAVTYTVTLYRYPDISHQLVAEKFDASGDTLSKRVADIPPSAFDDTFGVADYTRDVCANIDAFLESRYPGS